MSALRVTWSAWVVLVLASCATQPATVLPGDRATQLAFARGALPFEVFGKVGLPRGTANLRWRQQDDRFELRFWGPFGTGVARIEGTPTDVVFERDDVRREGDPAAILAAELGWHIPVAALAYWARGLAAPDWPVTDEQFEAGRPASFAQAGWTIRIDRYVAVEGGALPARIVATGPEGRFTIVLHDWRVGANALTEPAP